MAEEIGGNDSSRSLLRPDADFQSIFTNVQIRRTHIHIDGKESRGQGVGYREM